MGEGGHPRSAREKEMMIFLDDFCVKKRETV